MTIEDSGIGISPNYLPKLFDKFTQETEGYYRKYEGSGLGLTLDQYFPDKIKSRILQNFYFASNSVPAGEKDNLDFAEDGREYSDVHKKYHPVLRDFLREFGY